MSTGHYPRVTLHQSRLTSHVSSNPEHRPPVALEGDDLGGVLQPAAPETDLAGSLEQQLAAQHVHFVAVFERHESAVGAVIEHVEMRAHQLDRQVLTRRQPVLYDEIAFSAAPDDEDRKSTRLNSSH